MRKINALLALALAAGLSSAVLAQGMKGHEGMDMKAMEKMTRCAPAPMRALTATNLSRHGHDPLPGAW